MFSQQLANYLKLDDSPQNMEIVAKITNTENVLLSMESDTLL